MKAKQRAARRANPPVGRPTASLLVAGQRVLDAGCGSGALGAASQACVPGPVVEGVQKHPRVGEAIKVHPYAGSTMPFRDRS